MIASLIVALVLSILTFVGFIAFMLIDEKHDNLRGFILVLTVLMIVSINSILMAVISSMIEDKPTAMDVYQGKTTLKYTVVDSVITDSTVVFRKEDL